MKTPEVTKDESEQNNFAAHYFNGKDIEGFIYLKWPDGEDFEPNMLEKNGFWSTESFNIGDENYLHFKIYERNFARGKGEDVIVTVQTWVTFKIIVCDNFFHGMDFVSRYNELIKLTYDEINRQENKN